jgi:hypothetical protein
MDRFKEQVMLHHIRSKQFLVLLGVLWVCPSLAIGADEGPIVLTPDDPSSQVVIDGPWDDSIAVSVVTVPADASSSAVADPSLPARQATSIVHPVTGETIHVNFVEVAEITYSVQTSYGAREFVEWLVNTERPFTEEAQLLGEQEGFNVHRPQNASSAQVADPACWVTGESVLDIPVWFDPDRSAPLTYRLKIVDIGDGASDSGIDNGPRSEPVGEGGDPGGNPDTPDRSNPLQGGDDDSEDFGGDGGDPGGNPNPPTDT